MKTTHAVMLTTLVLSACGGCGRNGASAPVSSSPNLPLTLVADPVARLTVTGVV